MRSQRPKIETQIDRTHGLPNRAQGVHGLNGPKSWALTHFEVIIIILWNYGILSWSALVNA
jgi:hypothetical protein